VPIPRTTLVVPDNQPYNIIMSYGAPGYFITSSSTPSFQTVAFSLNTFVNYTDLVGVFDQYRILEAELWLMPRVGQITSSASYDGGLLTTVIDYDNSATPPNTDALLQYANSITDVGGHGHYRKWKPHAALAAYSGASSSFANVTSPWCDCASPGISHYGFKAGCTVTDQSYTYDLEVRALIQFRNVI